MPLFRFLHFVNKFFEKSQSVRQISPAKTNPKVVLSIAKLCAGNNQDPLLVDGVLAEGVDFHL